MTDNPKERAMRLQRLCPKQKGAGVSWLTIESNKTNEKLLLEFREVFRKVELEKSPWRRLNNTSEFQKCYLGWDPPLFNHLNFDGMTDYEDNILLDLESEITDLKPHTKNIFSIWPPSPYQYQKTPKLYTWSNISKRSNILENQPHLVTQTLLTPWLKNLDPELAEIWQQRGKFPWWTGYLPKWHSQGLDILIYKDPNDYRPHMLLPIFLFDIKANNHNKHLRRTTMIKV